MDIASLSKLTIAEVYHGAESPFLQVLRCLLSVGLLVGEAAAWLSLLGQLGGEVKIMRMIMLKSTQ